MSNLVLVISEDGQQDGQLRSALTRTASHCQVEFAASRAEIPTTHRPSLILLDLMLSREPAFDVLRWLRSEQRYQQIPVFVLGSEIAQGIAAYASLMPSPARPS